jgi:hypothetical protein
VSKKKKGSKITNAALSIMPRTRFRKKRIIIVPSSHSRSQGHNDVRGSSNNKASDSSNKQRQSANFLVPPDTCNVL